MQQRQTRRPSRSIIEDRGEEDNKFEQFNQERRKYFLSHGTQKKKHGNNIIVTISNRKYPVVLVDRILLEKQECLV